VAASLRLLKTEGMRLRNNSPSITADLDTPPFELLKIEASLGSQPQPLCCEMRVQPRSTSAGIEHAKRLPDEFWARSSFLHMEE
jgi:hypothetical protein